MADGSDAIADWPILNALVNASSGATWVSVHHGGGDHEPDGARLGEFLDEFVEGAGAGGAFGGELLDGVRAAIVDDRVVAVFLQAADHVGAHSSETDHSELHGCGSSEIN